VTMPKARSRDKGDGSGKPLPVTVELREEVGIGTYANYVQVSHSPEEFVLTFAVLPPQTVDTADRVREQGAIPAAGVARVFIPFALVPRLIKAIQEHWERYEAQSGGREEDA